MYSNIEFYQKLGLFKSRKYTLVGNRDIELTKKGFFSTQKNHIPFANINPTPIEYQKLNIKTLLYSVFFFVCLCVCITGFFTLAQIDKTATDVAFFATLLFIGFIYNVNACINESAKALIYTHIDTNREIFYIVPCKNKSEEVDEFTTQMKKRCESIKLLENLSLAHQHEIFIRYLEFLCQSNVLTESEFLTAIERLQQPPEKADVIKLV
jgi:Na+(H+)/acetate symporter ActP